ncbi:heme ABC exporter ATP-binding protein CcmA [Stella sp.]|uniref:heme ABC exporter ATP-binding protein CcmA n=1 Tax=Stella sp. TaxID=2912054 RepID=UPI0035B4DAFA
MSVFAGSDLGCVRGERPVFRHLSFSVESGSALTLTGANGAGKSSLLRLMAGLLPAAAGRLTWDGGDVAADPEAHRGRIAWIGAGDAVKPNLTVLENARFWAEVAGGRRGAAAAALDRFGLDRFGLAGLADTPARFLSQGQRRRLALSRLLAVRRPVWLLDEPTVGLDAGAVAGFEAVLAEHCRDGGLAVLATHVPIATPGARVLVLRRTTEAAAC